MRPSSTRITDQAQQGLGVGGKEYYDEMDNILAGRKACDDFTHGGPLTVVASPVVFDGEQPALERAPDLGEHTDEILAGPAFIGLDLSISGK